MAEALCRALLASDLANPDVAPPLFRTDPSGRPETSSSRATRAYTRDKRSLSVVAYDPRGERTDLFGRELGVKVAATPEEVLREAEVVVLAFKPQDAGQALRPLRELFGPKHLIVSILAGTSTRYLEELLPEGVRVVRVMPNLLITVKAGAAALAGGLSATQQDVEFVRDLFSVAGQALVVEEKLLDAVTALSGSGPAYFFYVVEALVQGAVAEGLPEDVARRLAEATCLGAGRLLLETGDDPGDWRQRVTSKGGTTAAALRVLEEAGVKEAFVQAVAAAAKRSRELGR